MFDGSDFDKLSVPNLIPHGITIHSQLLSHSGQANGKICDCSPDRVLHNAGRVYYICRIKGSRDGFQH